MDSTLTLALMMKSRLIFERDATFLSFPLSPISYSAGDLSFVTDANLTAPDLTNLSEFSSLVNMVPDDVMWPPADTKYVSDAYGDILQNADLAQSTRSSDEEKQYEEALAFLYTDNPDGTRSPSAALTAYQQYRDAYIVAQQNYANAKSTADTSSDPAVKSQWATQGPTLLQAIQNAENDWIEKGYKAQVEERRGVEQRLGAKSPEIEWQKWTTQFDPKISTLTDSSGQSFYPSVPSPANVLEAGAQWQQFTMLGDEADTLVRQAPADLRARLAPGYLDVALEKMSFEYSSLLIKRAWFDPAIFAQRFWRFSDATHIVSDGQSLKNGTCAAYVVALVFVRNIQVQLAADPARNGPVVSHIQAGNALNLGFFALQPDRGAPQERAAVELRSAQRPVVEIAPVQMASISDSPVTAAVGSAVATPTLARPVSMSLLQARSFRRIDLPTSPSPPSDPAPPAPPQPTVDTAMYVLSFICRPVPKSPDPDSALTWN